VGDKVKKTDEDREQPVEPGQVWRRNVDEAQAFVIWRDAVNAWCEYPATGRKGWIAIDSLRNRYRLEKRP
jgi:hypothetical protein